jgi:hypothetical protein
MEVSLTPRLNCSWLSRTARVKKDQSEISSSCGGEREGDSVLVGLYSAPGSLELDRLFRGAYRFYHCPDDGGSMDIRNVSLLERDCTALGCHLQRSDTLHVLLSTFGLDIFRIQNRSDINCCMTSCVVGFCWLLDYKRRFLTAAGVMLRGTRECDDWKEPIVADFNTITIKAFS